MLWLQRLSGLHRLLLLLSLEWCRIVLWNRRQVRLVSEGLRLWCIAAKPSPCRGCLKGLRSLWLPKWVCTSKPCRLTESSLLRLLEARCLGLRETCLLRLLEACLLRVEARLLRLEAGLLELHSLLLRLLLEILLLSHLVFLHSGLLDRIEEVNQVCGVGLLFGPGCCLRTVGRGLRTWGSLISSSMTRSPHATRMLLGQVFVSTEIEIRVVKVVLEKSRQIC